MGEPLVLGWSHTRFGKLDESLGDLVRQAGRGALEDAGVEAADIGLVVMGHFNSGMQPLGFPSSLALEVDEALFGVPALRVENACASGSTAVHVGLAHLLSGAARHVLVVGRRR